MSRLARGLLAACLLAAFVGPVWEARQRAPEATVRAYFAAVERGDVDAALETILPTGRDEQRLPVENQRGNGYRVDVLVLASPSFLARALSSATFESRATILAEVTPVVGRPWRSTTSVELTRREGRWYLLSAPFA